LQQRKFEEVIIEGEAWYWPTYSQEPYCFQRSPKDCLLDRFKQLAFYRILQVVRQMDIDILKESVSPTDQLTQSTGGIMGYLNAQGAISGEVKGKDKRGYAYKTWKLIDANPVQERLKKLRIKPIPPSGLEAIRERAKVDQNG
jgi:hypothetical protein